MQALLLVHLMSLGIWFGIVLVESILELRDPGIPGYKETVASTHKIIDLYCEIPAFTLVLVSGIAMIDTQQMHGWYLVKIIAGTTAVLINIWCVRQVLGRAVAARAQHSEHVTSYTRRIVGSGLVALPFAAVALVIGATNFITT